MIGFYHQPRHSRPALALDLMEPLRPLIADSAVLSAVNTKMVSERDLLTVAGRKGSSARMRPGWTRSLRILSSTIVSVIGDYSKFRPVCSPKRSRAS